MHDTQEVSRASDVRGLGPRGRSSLAGNMDHPDITANTDARLLSGNAVRANASGGRFHAQSRHAVLPTFAGANTRLAMPYE